ncbi:Cysteine-rich secretory protein family protein [Salegentibacter echinorum]|uniref:Cysteine-rich secretory protein family protein n=1 Tax=Salegentibacter echinorum TaxID=1073325 RepID=A0A1M5D0L8_SALEC|nr:CAP domain-containing protein [Salegentibacter echinorum]SHF60563.1 Cysteine-rich secretory protein family protein [Salegentibacter echinorum]
MLRKIIKIHFIFLAVLPISSCTSEDNTSTPVEIVAEKSFDYSKIEKEILKLVNDYRTTLELNSLYPKAEISLEARVHNFYMIEKGETSHDNFAARSNSLKKVLNAKAIGENVAYGYRTANAVVDAWIESEGHRENLEGNFTHFGISVERDEAGRYYFTNIFLRQ